ncbi:MAG: hypothetical protein MAG431_02368 [Chloroflexi bacterium]|nr:hypothetical protein [Chloroflexota bacterium]
MPAIKPARLKIQCAELGMDFSKPRTFIPRLHSLLSFYADRVSRPGEASQPLPLMDAYHVPPPVLRCLEQELAPRVESFPQEALSLADALWEEECLETRQLAAILLSYLPPSASEPILERVRAWGETCQEDRLQRVLYDQGVSKLRRHAQEEFLDLVGELMASPEKASQRGGLYALIPLLEGESFQNLPIVYRMMTKLLKRDETSLETEIVAVIEQLAKRSQQETAFFLREKLATAAKPRITRVVRRSLPFFSEEHETSLRGELREQR